MKVWITKFALTTGIQELEVEHDDRYPRMVTARTTGLSRYFHGNDWHLTEESARQRAREMQGAKISSTRKQLSALEKMSF
jgi:hypothetical protein